MGNKGRILVIDDDEAVRLRVRDLLERSDTFTVDEASDGFAGLEAVQRHPPDLILLDIMMPGIDGWETLTRLKREAATAGIPVVIFTAREHARGHQKSAEMGAADYFRKPFEPDELIELVEKHVSQRA